MPRIHFLLCSLFLVCASSSAVASVAAEALYADCTAAHIPVNVRKAQDWVKVRRCENVVVGTVRGLGWPLQAPSETKWPGGAITHDLLICPTDPTSYDETKLVEFYLKYWDQQGVGYISGKTQSAQQSVVEAFAAQFGDCAKKGK